MLIPHSSIQPKHPDRHQAEDAEYYRQVLHELIDIGADLARAVHEQAAAEVAAAADTVLAHSALTNATVAFERIARTVRRTIALARHVAEPLSERARHDAGHDAGRAAGQRAAARKQIIRKVEDAIHFEARNGTEAESLQAELLERLDGPDLEDWNEDWGLDQPIEKIIAEIEADLGLSNSPGMPVRKRRTPEDIAILCARAAAPSASRAAGVVRERPACAGRGSDPPANPAETVAALLRHAAFPAGP